MMLGTKEAAILIYLFFALLTYAALRPYKEAISFPSIVMLVVLAPIVELPLTLICIPTYYHQRLRNWIYGKHIERQQKAAIERYKKQRGKKLTVIDGGS
jgi:hypothetical protein